MFQGQDLGVVKLVGFLAWVSSGSEFLVLFWLLSSERDSGFLLVFFFFFFLFFPQDVLQRWGTCWENGNHVEFPVCRVSPETVACKGWQILKQIEQRSGILFLPCYWFFSSPPRAALLTVVLFFILGTHSNWNTTYYCFYILYTVVV